MRRGFTLIEILMVVAIIGIIMTVTLASVTTARDRGIDSQTKENLHTIRNQAELRHSNLGSYGTAVAVQGAAITSAPAYNATGAHFLISDQQANRALSESLSSAGSGYFAIGVNGQSWAVAVATKAVTGYWCVDAQGSAKVIASATLGGGSSAAACP